MDSEGGVGSICREVLLEEGREEGERRLGEVVVLAREDREPCVRESLVESLWGLGAEQGILVHRSDEGWG